MRCVPLTVIGAALFVTEGWAATEFADEFRGAEIVILGEIHDNPVHHRNQADLVRELQPDALVFEMIEPKIALSVTPQTRSDEAFLERLLSWEANGWPDFGMYYPIFEAAPKAAIFGGGAPRQDVLRAVRDGAADVFGGASALFGIDEPLDPAQLSERIVLQREAHCNALPEEMLSGMVEAQRLRDAALASAAVAALLEAQTTDDTPQVVVIAGNGHARDDWGVPALLRDYFSDAPGIEIKTFAQYERTAPDAAPYTNWIATEAADRRNPCDVFD